MKRTSRFIALFLALIMCVSCFAACGDGEGETTTAAETTVADTTASAEDTTAPDEETTGEPAVTTEEPAVTTEEPAVTTEEPAVTTEEPAVTTEEPAVTTEEPAVTTEEPAVTTEEPAVTTEEPAVTTEEPSETSAPHVHNYKTRLVTKFPTCTLDGAEKLTCECGEYEMRVLPAAGHVELTVYGKAATCTEKGLTDGKKCSVCGIITMKQTETAKKAHTYDSAEDASCNVCGYKRDVACSHKNTEEIPAKAATCTSTGLTAGKVCKDCEAILTEQLVVPVAKHTETVVNGRDATCTEKGLTDGKKCSVCGIFTVAQTEIPKKAHTEESVSGKAATCTEKGLTDGKKCSVCGTVTVKQTEIPAMGHTEVTVSGKAATCTENGLTDGRECVVCETVIIAQEVIPAAGHSEVVIAGKAATCTEGGITDGKKCTTCGIVTVEQSEIPAAGHSYVNGVCTACNDKYSVGLLYERDENGDGYSVTGIGSCTDTDIIIPALYEGDPVTSIGFSAFEGCSSITSITIPASINSIYGDAFYDCASLQKVYITDLEAWLAIDVWISGTNGIPLCCTNPCCYGAELYLNGEKITELVIPESVTRIRREAFSGCSSITGVVIHSGVTSIERFAFAGCISLESITVAADNPVYHSDGNCIIETATKTLAVGCGASVIPSDGSVETIDAGAFFRCPSLTKTTIPGSITAIETWAFCWCDALKSVVIGNGVTAIGGSAFAYCGSLESVTIPVSLKSISDGAFCGCNSLAEVNISDLSAWLDISFENYDFEDANPCCNGAALYLNGELLEDLVIPDGVTSIGNNAFAGCSSIKSVVIPDSVTDIRSDAFIGCSSLKSVVIGDGVVSIDMGIFSYCSSLESVSIGKGVASIDSGAFYDCPKLDSISVDENNPVYRSAGNCLIETATKTLVLGGGTCVIPTDGSVTSIGDDAFSSRKSLTSITIPEGVTRIGNDAFWGCSSLTSAVIPNSIMSMGSGVFWNCVLLEYNTYGNGKYLGNSEHPYLVLCDVIDYSAKTFTFSADAKIIYESVFSGCESLESVSIPNTVVDIGAWAFSDCSSLTSISIPEGITDIYSGVFRGCTSLGVITVPNSIKNISPSAFSGCLALQYNEYKNGRYLGNGEEPYLVLVGVIDKSVSAFEMSSGVKIIYDFAFEDCSALAEIIIPEGVVAIGGSAFYGCSSLASIIISKSVASIGAEAFANCYALKSVYVSDMQAWLSILFDGYCSNPCSYGADLCLNGEKVTVLTVPAEVEKIGDYAFDGCISLTEVIMHDKVKSIGASAFSGCIALTSISIPDSLTYIGMSAFANCKSLKNVNIPKGVVRIDEYVFEYCSSLESITIPDGVKAIENFAFEYCTALAEVVIPVSVTSIGSFVFDGCSAIKEITFGGTKAQWESVEKGYCWDGEGSEYTVRCTDGDVANA